MRQIQLLRVAGHDAIDRDVCRIRVEVRWRRGRKDELSCGRIEFAVGDAEAVAGEDTAGNGVVETVVVQRMAFGIQRLHLAAVEIKPLLIAGDHDTCLVDRLNIAIHLLCLFNTVDRLGPCDQLRRVCHVQRTARVYNAAGVRQLLHEKARAASMIEMNVGEEYEVDIGNVEVASP